MVLTLTTQSRRHGEKIGKAPMKKYKFEAKIQAGDRGGAYVLFPYDTEKEFATKGRVPVKATFNGVPYTGSLIKYGKPQHVLGVPKAIREQIGKGPGDTIEIVIWRDENVRTLEVPAQFETLMRKEGVLPFFEKLSYTHRKEYCRWITEAKKEETRLKRLGKAIEMLKKRVKTPG
jgi:bifunctional DNA-binding transcriptional regulator/antitoxin component of YhaV-PrlF toxin-antitoxin module